MAPATPALIVLEDAVRAALTDTGFTLLDMDADPETDSDQPGGVSLTADMPSGSVLVRWEVHDNLATLQDDNPNPQDRARYQAIQYAMHTALVGILHAYNFRITANQPGQTIQVTEQ
uniref:hypothetical protein n=1 Tax=Streptomyces tubercidicus TaxID=47759 RepID=UPI0030E00D68|nr:hypothetical protein OG690_37960 [Streptomyces tubercidicus]